MSTPLKLHLAWLNSNASSYIDFACGWSACLAEMQREFASEDPHPHADHDGLDSLCADLDGTDPLPVTDTVTPARSFMSRLAEHVGDLGPMPFVRVNPREEND